MLLVDKKDDKVMRHKYRSKEIPGKYHQNQVQGNSSSPINNTTAHTKRNILKVLTILRSFQNLQRKHYIKRSISSSTEELARNLAKQLYTRSDEADS